MATPKYLTRDGAAAMVSQWDGLAWKFARKYHGLSSRRGDIADYHAAGVIGLWEAALRYDPSASAFGTYANRWVHLRVLEHSRAEVSGGLHIPAYRGAVRIRPVAFGGHEPPVPVVDAASPDFWEAVDRRLPTPQIRAAVRLIFRDGLSEFAAARVLGVSRPRVNYLRRQALDILRQHPALIEAA